MSNDNKPKIQIVSVTRGAAGLKRVPSVSNQYLQPFASANPIHSVSVAPPTRYPAVYQGDGIVLCCEDGHSSNLGNVSALLTGRSRARDRILEAILTNTFSAAGSVIMLSASNGESSVERIAKDCAHRYAQPSRIIRKNSGTPGFTPLAGWSEDNLVSFFCKRIAASYIGHSSMPSDNLRICFKALLHLARSGENEARSIMQGIGSLRDLLKICEESDIPERDCYASKFRSKSEDALLAVQILGDYLRAFQGICVPDAGGVRYSLFSSGLTVLKMNDQTVKELCSAPWYLCQMAGMISEAACGNVTLLVDEVCEDVLTAFSGVMMDQSIRLLVVCDNYMAFGNQDIRARVNSRFRQQFVFTQQESTSAQYWSQLSSEQKVLVKTYNQSGSESHTFLQLPTYTNNEAYGYQEVFRPVYDIGYFTKMNDNEGDLIEINSDTGEAFHHFSLE